MKTIEAQKICVFNCIENTEVRVWDAPVVSSHPALGDSIHPRWYVEFFDYEAGFRVAPITVYDNPADAIDHAEKLALSVGIEKRMILNKMAM
jgi:hypothetical protein